jgi:DNA-binding LacI/PurR family transcriptional regulator
MKKITVKEVANIAGVSTATVSRVLNNNYPVSDDVKTRVLEAVKNLNYTPNGIARSLKSNRTNLIGVVVADISNSFFMNLGKGVEDVLEKEDYNLIFCSTNESAIKEQKILNVLIEKKVDALIISVCDSNFPMLETLMANDIKVVLIDRKLTSAHADCIVNDNFSGSFLLTDYLLKKGHTQIALLHGNLSTSTAQERLDGYKSALNKGNVPLQEKYLLDGNYSRQRAYKEVEKLIQSGNLPTAIYCGNNVMAEGVIKALKDYKLDIPQDVSVVSFGMIDNQELIEPRITCLNQNPFLMGQKAGEIILRKISSNEDLMSKEVVLCNEFIEGESVKQINLVK